MAEDTVQGSKVLESVVNKQNVTQTNCSYVRTFLYNVMTIFILCTHLQLLQKAVIYVF